MANSKINTVNVGGVDFSIQASSGSSDSSFVDDTIEAALKNLIDSFSVDGTYTGRFKATNAPDKWFSYQIDLFDTVASGYIVNILDAEESYTVRYKKQIDEQAVISSIGKMISQLSVYKGDAEQLVVDISATTGIEIGRWIKNNIPLEKLTKGFTFNFIPTQSPGWWSGQMFCDGGSTWWGYYINRDTGAVYKYRYASDSDTIQVLNQFMPNYSNTIVSSITSGYTSTVKGWLVGSVGVTGSGMGIYINGIPVAYDSQGAGQASYATVQTPINIGDVITFTITPTYNDLRILGLR